MRTNATGCNMYSRPKVGNHLQECDDDAYDTIVPVTQDGERQDKNEG